MNNQETVDTVQEVYLQPSAIAAAQFSETMSERERLLSLKSYLEAMNVDDTVAQGLQKSDDGLMGIDS